MLRCQMSFQNLCLRHGRVYNVLELVLSATCEKRLCWTPFLQVMKNVSVIGGNLWMKEKCQRWVLGVWRVEVVAEGDMGWEEVYKELLVFP